MSVTIRPFAHGDKDTYLRFARDFYSGPAVQHPVPDEYFVRTFDTCTAGSPYARGYLLLLDDKAAGYGLLSLTWSAEAGGICVFLEELYLTPACQGHGTGSAFIRFVEAEFAGTAKRLRLEVSRQNPNAMRLYERLGYTRIEYLQMAKDF